MRITLFLGFIILFSCNPRKENIKNPIFIPYTVQSTFPHDRNAFTEGLLIHDGQLYESTGQEDSWIGIVNVKTGVADKKVTLEKLYFGEGITILNNKIYQLTWEHHKGFVYDLKTFKKLNEFEYNTEGWGLTHNNSQLIMSDGTSTLYFMDTLTLKVKQTLKVNYKDQSLAALNELEFIGGFIFANVWRTNWIAKIDPATGEVAGFLDLSKLSEQTRLLNPNADVLNGIAWHEGTHTMLATGKYWPYIYVLKIDEPI